LYVNTPGLTVIRGLSIYSSYVDVKLKGGAFIEVIAQKRPSTVERRKKNIRIFLSITNEFSINIEN